MVACMHNKDVGCDCSLCGLSVGCLFSDSFVSCFPETAVCVRAGRLTAVEVGVVEFVKVGLGGRFGVVKWVEQSEKRDRNGKVRERKESDDKMTRKNL